MKRAIALGLLTVLLVIGVGCFGTLQREISTDTFTTFNDWCRHRGRLTREARHTVRVLLDEADTRSCDQASSELTALTYLNLWSNQIRDVSPLTSLPHLTKLYLDNNQIRDVAPLASLTNLLRLDLSGNQIADVPPSPTSPI